MGVLVNLIHRSIHSRMVAGVVLVTTGVCLLVLSSRISAFFSNATRALEALAGG